MRPLTALLLALCLLCPAARAAEEPPVTRAQFAGLLWDRLGAVPYDANGPFTDVEPGHPYAAAVSWLAHEGVLLGTGGSRFDPERSITREEAAVLLRRTARWLEWPPDATFTPDGLAACNDYEGISPWADDSLYWTCTTGLMDWSPGGRLDPGGGLTEGEADAVLDRFFAP